jgi:hypothetical protein
MDVEAVLIKNMLPKLHYQKSKVWKRSYGPWARIPTLYENMNYNSFNALFFWCGRSNGKYLISAHFSNSTVCWLQMWVSHFWQHIRIEWMENFPSITCNWAVSTKSTCWDDWFSRIKRNGCNIYIRKLDQDEPTPTKFNSVFGITKKYEKNSNNLFRHVSAVTKSIEVSGI